MLPVDQTVDTVDLDLHPNEASDLAVVPGGLARCDQTFVTVLDEGVIEAVDRDPRASRRRCHAAAGRRSGCR